MELTKLSKTELFVKCEELGITKYKSKNKEQLIKLINDITLKKIKPHIEFIIEEEPENNEEFIIIPTKKNIQFINNSNISNVIDLFCGCGGMSKGLTDAGFNIIAGIDIWDKAINS